MYSDDEILKAKETVRRIAALGAATMLDPDEKEAFEKAHACLYLSYGSHWIKEVFHNEQCSAENPCPGCRTLTPPKT